jgi:hypothetical protein
MDQRHDFPGELPVIPSGLSGGEIDLVPGEGFWTRIEQIALKGEMTRGLDMAMHGKASPRIWLFLHEPGRGELSTATAMSFARELAFRDQAALLLDCDDGDMALTRWAGRVEAEGWIDLARYGTSVLTSGVPMPFVGRRGYLLGVGSFAPTHVTGEEIDSLLTRLRRQGDDLLLVAPADSMGRLWAPAATIRIFCWDQQTMSAEKAGAISAEFTEAGCPLTAVATFQETGAAGEMLVEEILSEDETVPETPAPAAPPETTETPEPEAEEPPVLDEPEIDPVEEEPVVDEPVVDDTLVDDSVVDETVPEEPEDEPDWRDLPLEATAEHEEPGPARETSRVFWFGAVVALVLIAVASIYYFKFVRVPSEGHFKEINVATETEPPATANEMASTEPGKPEDLPSATVGADSLAVTGQAMDDTLDAVTVTEPVREAAPDTVVPVEIVTEEADQVAEFDMSPYLEPVGAKGWAIHVYSLSDSPGTAKEVKELDRRGFRSEVKVFDLGEKGRWFRIYLGSFASKSEARQAMPALLEKLGEDWAKPERFETSAPE